MVLVTIMCKNEESTIEKTLRSVGNHPEKIHILDTGSTDKTLSIIKKYFEENKIEHEIKQTLFEEPFDFQKARNYFLNYINTTYVGKNKWVIALDCNDEIRQSRKLFRFLENYRGTCIGFYVDLVWKNKDKTIVNPSIRIFKTNHNWVYGPLAVHEVLMNPAYDTSKPLEESKNIVEKIEYSFFQDREEDDKRSELRCLNDQHLLLDNLKRLEKECEEQKKKPEEHLYYPRCLFYLAQTYLNCGVYHERKGEKDKMTEYFKKAIEYYKKRISIKTAREEVYHSCYEVGTLLYRLGESTMVEIEGYIKESFVCSPRVEPLLFLTRHYFKQYLETRSKSALLYADMYSTYSLELDYPEEDLLFVDKFSYDYGRYRMNADVCLEMYDKMDRKDKLKQAISNIKICSKINVKDKEYLEKLYELQKDTFNKKKAVIEHKKLENDQKEILEQIKKLEKK